MSDAFKIKNLRWWIAILLMGITTINYPDRITLSVAAPEFKKSLGIGEVDYSYIVNAFQLAYLIMMPIAGRIIDWLGLRLGFTLSIIAWLAASAICASRSLCFCCRAIMIPVIATPTATIATRMVASALMSGLTPRRTFEKMTIGSVLEPGPATKLVITRSSSDSVKASNQPDISADFSSAFHGAFHRMTRYGQHISAHVADTHHNALCNAFRAENKSCANLLGCGNSAFYHILGKMHALACDCSGCLQGIGHRVSYKTDDLSLYLVNTFKTAYNAILD